MAPPCLCVDASAVTRLVRKVDIPGVFLKAAAGTLSTICQDWVYQNPGIRLDGGIYKDGSGKRNGKNLCFPTKCYDVPCGRVGIFLF